MTDPKVDVRALAQLARLEVSDAELARLEEEIPAILKFVESIQGVAGGAREASPAVRNVMRADGTPHETGMYTSALIDAAPKQEGNRILVKQVLSRKQK